jgi:hypothetical protein
MGTLLVSLLAYMGIARLVIAVRGGEAEAYMGIDQMGNISFADIPSLVNEAYWGAVRFYFTEGDRTWLYFNIHHKLAVLLFAAAFVASAVLLVSWCRRAKIQRDWKRLLLLLALLFLLPLGCNIVFAMTPGLRHLLMFYGLVRLLVFPIALQALYPLRLEEDAAKNVQYIVHIVSCWTIVITLAFAIYNYTVLANKAYLKMTLGYEQAYAQSVSLATRIQSLAGYRHDQEIVLVGLPYRNMEVNKTILTEFDSFEIIGVHGSRLFGGIYTYHAFLNNYLGLRHPITINREENVTAAEAAFLAAMPQYPDEGSIAIVDGKIYVKFSYDPNNPPDKLFY